MSRCVLDLEELGHAQVAVAGGKGAHLAELSRIPGVRVPPGFCITTGAFRQILEAVPSLDDRLDRLSHLRPDDHETIRAASLEIRRMLEQSAIPDDLAESIERHLSRHGSHAAYAVRSSATAEDSPTASFAGQHDTYLDVVGISAILEHVQRCWASLFSERAVTYRLRNGIEHRTVRMAVVVQRMVFPRLSGVLFTADPITGNRRIAAVEATIGLGEAFVSGLVNPDLYRVRDGTVISTTRRQAQPTLTDAQVVRLADLGRRIEAHFGRPQDVEWCLVDEDFHIVQSRPITTLFPIPDANDREHHVYVSVGHQQMMTDAMKPLGLSYWNMTTPRPMSVAGGRLFVDVTRLLASPVTRAGLLDGFGRTDPLLRDALQSVIDRGDFIKPIPDQEAPPLPAGVAPIESIETDPSIVDELIARSERSIAALKREIATTSGTELLDFILSDIEELRRILFDRRSHRVFMTAMEATWWLNAKLEEWLGEKNVADTLTLSVPSNVTSEMGLALLDVADVIRPKPAVVEFLEHTGDESFLNALPAIAGGRDARDAIVAWLDKYGMRGPGEIDITRPRWSERPRMLLPLLLGNIRNFEPGAARRRFEHGRAQASRKEQEVLARLHALPDGAQKADETKRMIDRVRTFIGYREYPKYGLVSRSFVHKQALLGEAERLVSAGVLREREDIFYLAFDELREVVRTHRVDAQLMRERRAAFESYRALTPPRVLTSEGEGLNGSYRRDDVPGGTLLGLPVSSGVVEGRARVVLDMAEAQLDPGDILVTAYTDPSWTPLFVAIRGLVTEVGGLMTHGAVIAREYGLPAVVGVTDATRRIRDGQRIRVHGGDGYVELLA